MKKTLFISGAILLFIALFYANHRYGLLSLAGLNDKGLVYTSVNHDSNSLLPTKMVGVDHSEWNRLLQRYVDTEGNVDYKSFSADKKQLDHYLKAMSEIIPSADWPIQEQLAYYINMYNAHTVNLILDHYPLKSIKDIDGAWTKDFVNIGDKQISLGGLEHSVLRKMNEPRIHFAINCASASCPKLLNEAFTPEKLEQQLEKVTFEFINSDKSTITQEEVLLSRIFKWYKGDFADGNLTEYINVYSEAKILPKTNIGYKMYDWSLNEQN